MMAVAGTVVHRAVGHSVSGRKNSQMTRKRVVCLHDMASSCTLNGMSWARKSDTAGNGS